MVQFLQSINKYYIVPVYMGAIFSLSMPEGRIEHEIWEVHNARIRTRTIIQNGNDTPVKVELFIVQLARCTGMNA